MTTLTTRPRGPLTLALIVLVAGLTGGCSAIASDEKADTSCATPDGLAIVAPVHANAPKASTDAELDCLIHAAVANQRPVILVTEDGTPEVVLNETYTLDKINSTVLEDSISAATTAVAETIDQAEANADGADTIEAISIAVDALHSAGADQGTLVLDTPGLPDTGVLVMTEPGMLTASPTEVANYVLARQNLDMSGMPVLLRRTGYTAGTQQGLGEYRASVTEIWESVLSKAGASVEVDPLPTTAAGPRTDYQVEPVEVPEQTPFTPTAGAELVYDDSQLRFLPDSAEFTDPQAAKATLREVSEWLTGGSGRTATIVGTAASAGTPEGQVRVSSARAAAVATALKELGVAASQLTSRGVGTNHPEHVDDLDAAGNLRPAQAVRNRTVRVTLSQ